MKPECPAFCMSHMRALDKSEGFKVKFFQFCVLSLMDYGTFSKAVVFESQNICLH